MRPQKRWSSSSGSSSLVNVAVLREDRFGKQAGDVEVGVFFKFGLDQCIEERNESSPRSVLNQVRNVWYKIKGDEERKHNVDMRKGILVAWAPLRKTIPPACNSGCERDADVVIREDYGCHASHPSWYLVRHGQLTKL